MAVDVAVLVSAGRHPASGRSRMAAADARALELGLRLGPSAALHVIHAGDPEEPALRDYLGMGVERLTLLRQPAGADVASALLAHLQSLQPRLILTGTAAEQGEGSGMLPYLLAERLGAVLLSHVAEVSLEATSLIALQALPRGRRRRLSAPLPALATVALAAAAPRQSAFARARRGRIEIVDMPAVMPAADERRILPARPKPRRLKLATGGSAAERLKAATEMQAGRGRLLVNPPAEEAARAIYDYLVEEGILLPAGLVPLERSG